MFRLESVRQYLADSLIQTLVQSVLHCAYYVFTRQRFDGDYDTLVQGGREVRRNGLLTNFNCLY